MASKTAATTKTAGTGNAPQKPGAPGDSYAPLDSAHFREAMSRIVTAVHILTTDGAAGRLGATVSAVCSVTDDPCSILVCVNRASRVHAAILKNRSFASTRYSRTTSPSPTPSPDAVISTWTTGSPWPSGPRLPPDVPA